MSAATPETAGAGKFSPGNSRALRWSLATGLAAMVAIGLVLLFLLTQATTNRAMYERNYARLFVLNVVVASLLLLLIVWIALRLIKRLRQGKFGSRLLVKLAAIFALAGFAPVKVALNVLLGERYARGAAIHRRTDCQSMRFSPRGYPEDSSN